MSSLNKAMLIGNLGQDPELRSTQSGTSVCTFSLATNEKWKDKQSGEDREETTWHRIVVWGKQGENCNKYLKKGKSVYVEGKLKTREWEDKEGNRKWTTEIIAQQVVFLGGGGGGGNRAPDHEDDDAPASSGDAFDKGFDDDQIPF